ncbi:MAG: mismatch-specific DNA-glycosylase [Bradyrhizobium sp.]|uniref:mismatch-specific DNA-glycosylase n=1 Tax=Bradyrhizobium sp. TaxID=376 RepID=UPI001C294576|nr:mismatch-specific DNA-glycosylase [Bradyrhizobium sp.]MBU6461320.1 mismatch-specific DNA-glycosylase [Pseudomonadota bacterium]MDE2066494.1 mismatch-specific DNA-glycosylase [Bradyrhizobium sp.]MDE2241583.1 mismatch-specific DNA-glycosylase [Bradyrhizobium sp.]MDE2467414.1 mismatch-specific DNA-glycosylase [Bradyrhizobium sp.]
MARFPKSRALAHAPRRTAPTVLTDVLPQDVLSDVLRTSLRAVLCGTAVGNASAKAGAYYAHKQNKFWKILHETGLTPTRLQPQQYRELLHHGIGLTDFVKTHSGMDHQIPLSELVEESRTRLHAAILKFRPAFLAFTSKTGGQKFLGGPRAYGEQAERIGDTRIWILPSTSGAANGSWRPEVWHSFADEVRAVTR